VGEVSSDSKVSSSVILVQLCEEKKQINHMRNFRMEKFSFRRNSYTRMI
jgi:hypothetical protein